MYKTLKRIAQICAVAVAFPSALLCGFGRFFGVYTAIAQAWALVPGKPGNLLRSGFYFLTLQGFSLDTNISFGTYFVHPETEVGHYVSVGNYCVIGKCSIGAYTQIAALVQILSGPRQHTRDEQGRLSGADHSKVAIGEYCWIGASAVVMADVGSRTTIGAGAIVPRPLPPNVTAVGNPARIVKDHGSVQSPLTRDSHERSV